MFELAFANLVSRIADGITEPICDHLALHIDVRAQREALTARIREAAQSAVAEAGEQIVDATRQRFADWLSHPRLGHGALVDEARAAEVSFQQAIVSYQAAPSVANTLALTLACVRVTAITRVIGPECVYLPPRNRGTKPAHAKANDRRKSRRAIALEDIPAALHDIVVALGAPSPDREAAIALLQAAIGTKADSKGVATKLHALVTSGEHDSYFAKLAGAVAGRAPVRQPLEHLHAAAPSPAVDTARSLDTELLHTVPPLPSTPAIAAPGNRALMNRLEVEPSTQLCDDQSTAGDEIAAMSSDDQGGADADLICSWVSSQYWALVDEGSVIALKRLAKRPDIGAAYDRVGLLPAVQARLRAIYTAVRK